MINNQKIDFYFLELNLRKIYFLSACVLDYEYENQFTSHIQLLHSTAAASTPSGCYVLQHILPKILQMYKDAVQVKLSC